MAILGDLKTRDITQNSIDVIVAVFAVVILSLVGCTSNDLYVQDFRIAGPLNRSTLHFTDGEMAERKVRISGGVAANSQSSIGGIIDEHTKVDQRGSTQFDSANGTPYFSPEHNSSGFRGRNLTWTLPGVKYDVNLDWVMSDHTIFSSDLNYAVLNGEDYFGGRFGLARFTTGDVLALRLDAGCSISYLRYHLDYAVIKSPVYSDSLNSMIEEVYLGSASGEDTHTNLYLGFSINTKVNEWPLNYLVQVSWENQDMIDQELYQKSNNVSRKSTFFNLTAGVVLPIENSVRLILGCTFLRNESIRGDRNPFFGMPVVQFDWRL